MSQGYPNESGIGLTMLGLEVAMRQVQMPGVFTVMVGLLGGFSARHACNTNTSVSDPAVILQSCANLQSMMWTFWGIFVHKSVFVWREQGAVL